MAKFSVDSSDQRLRIRMIRDAEGYLDRNIDQRDVTWPRRPITIDTGRHGRRNAEQASDAARESAVVILPSPFDPQVVEVRGDSQQHFDDTRAQELYDRLILLIEAGRCGDLIVDFSHVWSATAALLNVVTALRKLLAMQRKGLALCGAQGDCAKLLQYSGMNLEHHATPEDALAADGAAADAGTSEPVGHEPQSRIDR